MPLGGSNILWNEAGPADTDSAGAGASEFRSDKTSIRNAMGSEHNWTAGGGPNTGYHLLGSARVFVDVQSNVSSSGTDGRILVTSDTSRLFHVGSTGTMFLGGQNAIQAGSQAAGGQRFYWADETGAGQTNAGGNATVTIPNSGYSGLPFVSLTAYQPAATAAYVTIGATYNATQFEVRSWNASGAALSTLTFIWRSLGTRTF